MRVNYDLSPRPVLVTGLVIALYLILWLSTAFIQAGLPDLPSIDSIEELGFDMTAASQDLKTIASSSHPYNSRQNDVVREYILKRLKAIRAHNAFVMISEDQEGGSYWYDQDSLTYFESKNIVVLIQGEPGGTQPIMLVAHYDSVATSPGAANSGVGVVTLLQLARHLSLNRPKRDVLLGFVNGEEDSLHGSRSLTQHVWARGTKTVLNLQGAGSGGRPIVLQASSHRMARSFRSLSYPHGSVLASDLLASGLFKNPVDSSIYRTLGMGSADVAFYQRRNKHHSFDDTIASLDHQGGAERTIWAMVNTASQAVHKLEKDKDPSPDEMSNRAVYFDIFGKGMAIFTINSVFAFNIVLLLFGPSILIIAYILLSRSPRFRATLEWTKQDGHRGWGRFLISLVICAGLTAMFSWAHSTSNPYIIISQSNIVILCLFSISLCSLCIPLYLFALFRPLPSPAPYNRQTTQTFISVYALWWILLVIDTVLLRSKEISGLYFITFFNAFSLAGVLIDLGTGMLYIKLAKSVDQDDTSTNSPMEDPSKIVEGKTDLTSRLSTLDPLFWSQPLTARHVRTPPEEEEEEVQSMHSYLKRSWKGTDRYGLWIAQLMISVSFPVLLVMQICLLLVALLSGTISDGASSIPVYLILAMMVTISVLPLAPFAHRMHPVFYGFLFLVFFITIIFDCVVFPFSTQDKSRIFWSQSLNVQTGSGAVLATGIEKYLNKAPLYKFPAPSSAQFDSDPFCGELACLNVGWQGADLKVVPDAPSSTWMNASVTRVNLTSARFILRAAGTKNCRLTFNKNISSLDLASATPIYFHPSFTLPKGGAPKVDFWARTEGRTINATVAWDPSFTGIQEEASLLRNGKNITRQVRVSCHYDDVTRGRIPALDDTIDRAPGWIAVVGRQPLVEVYREFDL